MKKNFKFYLIIWAMALITFNVIVFAVPHTYSGVFWIGYAFIILAFLGQLTCAYITFKPAYLGKVFLNLPLITISYTGLITSIIVGTLCMVIDVLPIWLGVLICCLTLVLIVIGLMKASAAAEIVDKIDAKVNTQTQFIKLLSVEAEHVLATANTPELKKVAKNVYEAIRYSDPMSIDALSNVESRIQSKFTAFEKAVKEENYELAVATSKEVLDLVDSRNKKCKVLK